MALNPTSRATSEGRGKALSLGMWVTPEGGNSPARTSVLQPQGTGFYQQQNEQEMESPQDFQRGAQPGPHLGFRPVRLSDFWIPELS